MPPNRTSSVANFSVMFFLISPPSIVLIVSKQWWAESHSQKKKKKFTFWSQANKSLDFGPFIFSESYLAPMTLEPTKRDSYFLHHRVVVRLK